MFDQYGGNSGHDKSNDLKYIYIQHYIFTNLYNDNITSKLKIIKEYVQETPDNKYKQNIMQIIEYAQDREYINLFVKVYK